MCHTEKEIQKTIAEAYAKYLRKPRVSVRVLGAGRAGLRL